MENGGGRRMTVSELSAALTTRGLITEEKPLAVDTTPREPASPWYVQVMMGFCAWLAGLLLLGFAVALLEDVLFRGHDNWGVLLVLGIIVCGGAVGLYSTVSQNSAFGTQFALAASFAGQTGIVVGLGGMLGVVAALWGMTILSLVLIVAVSNRLHRFLMAVCAVIAWTLAWRESVSRALRSAFEEAVAGGYHLSFISIVLWMVEWGPVAFAAWWLVRHEADWMADRRDNLLRPVMHGAIAALAIVPLGTHPATFWLATGLERHGLADGSYGWAALWPLLALLLAVLALALAYTVRNKALMGLAIVFGLFEVGSFYYVLGITLLMKSIIMIVLGAGLIGWARWLATEAK
jgi:hypothetical protein